MMKKLFSLVAMVTLLGMTSCKNEEPAVTPAPESGKTISLVAQMANFTRATDTAFEEGDKVGLYIFTPEVYLNNAEFTYTAEGLSSTIEHKWYADEELTSSLVAYYPYNNAWSYSESVSFSVNKDQSAHAAYTASDLMIASTTAKPTEEAVLLPFTHALSKVSIKIDNQLEEEITKVGFNNVYTTVTFDPKSPATMTTAGEKGQINAGLTAEGEWILILAPQQDAEPTLVVSTATASYTFTLPAAVDFEAGKVMNASITVVKPVVPEAPVASFTTSVSNWEDGGTLDFVQNDNVVIEPEIPATKKLYLKANEWSSDSPRMEAYFFGNGEKWITMTPSATSGVYECELPEGYPSVIFVRMNPAAVEHNWDSKWNQTKDLTIPTDGKNCYQIIYSSGNWKEDDLTDAHWTTL
uniref:fimbrillin family protein n=1 Tax=Alistipes sp. TaxID=1872444 RepID=UPI0040568B11